MDFRGVKITSDLAFLLLRKIDERFKIVGQTGDTLEDARYSSHIEEHSLVQMVRQSVYQVAAGYEDSIDADFPRIEHFGLRPAKGSLTEVAALNPS